MNKTNQNLTALIIVLVMFNWVVWEIRLTELHDFSFGWYLNTQNINKSLREPIKWVKKRATLTKYLKTGNKMANGEYPYIGACASSDRSIPFGTVVKWDTGQCVVKDRTALWVGERFGLTFDIYTEETKQEALNFGRQIKWVELSTE